MAYHREGKALQSDLKGVLEGKDNLFMIAFELTPQRKVMTRTRRKFWDDVSFRGGQYSALMLALTALY